MTAELAVRAGGAAACAGVEVEYVDPDRGRVRRPLAACWSSRFERVSPVRGFASFRGQRNWPGWWWFSRTGEHVGYESWVERDVLMALDADPGVEAVASQPMWLHWVSSDPMVKASSAWQGCPEAPCHGRSGEVVTVQWPRRVDADDIRARWVQVQWRFSPFAGRPPPGRQQAPLRFADREADIDDVAIALGVVSSRSELWEAQGQVVHDCTRREADAATCWQTVAGLDPAETTWRAREGIADFVVQAESEAPIQRGHRRGPGHAGRSPRRRLTASGTSLPAWLPWRRAPTWRSASSGAPATRIRSACCVAAREADQAAWPARTGLPGRR